MAEDAGLWDWLGRYKKAVASAAATAITWGYTVVASQPDNITAEEWLGLAGVALSGLVVAKVTNK